MRRVHRRGRQRGGRNRRKAGVDEGGKQEKKDLFFQQNKGVREEQRGERSGNEHSMREKGHCGCGEGIRCDT